MKTIFTLISGLIIANTSFAVDKDPFGIQGTYNCTGYDSVDGVYPTPSPKAILSYNAKHSIPSKLFAAYDLKLIEPDGSGYSGIASLSGNSLAIYFANTDPKKTDDHGVGVAKVTHEFIKLDANKKPVYQIKFSKFYYEPTYNGSGSHGFETCTKIND